MSLHKCKRVSKSLAAIIMIIIMTFSVTTTSYENAYAAVGESIVIGGTAVITVETAIAWILGLFGLYAASALVYENRDNLMIWGHNRLVEFQEFCETTYDKAQIAAEDALAWMENLARGTLDKASEVYQAFKAWCETLIKGRKVDVADAVYTYDMAKITRDLEIIENADYTDGKGFTKSPETGCYEGFIESAKFISYGTEYVFTTIPIQPVACMYKSHETDTNYFIEYGVCSFNDFDALYSRYYPIWNSDNVTTRVLRPFEIKIGDYTVYALQQDSALNSKEKHLKSFCGNWISSVLKNTMSTYATTGGAEKLLALTFLDYLGLLDVHNFVEESEVSVSDKTREIYDRDGTLDNYDIVSPVTDSDVASDVITIPWENIGTYDEDGVLDISDVLDQPIADVAGDVVVPVDRADDTTIADDVPIADVITNTSDLKDYTAKGLESVFPFCIPFDFIEFINCLSADPVAPKFEWKMTFLESMGFDAYTITIDLATFDSVAKIMRIMELLAFIIALIMATRGMFIRG